MRFTTVAGVAVVAALATASGADAYRATGVTAADVDELADLLLSLDEDNEDDEDDEDDEDSDDEVSDDEDSDDEDESEDVLLAYDDDEGEVNEEDVQYARSLVHGKTQHTDPLARHVSAMAKGIMGGNQPLGLAGEFAAGDAMGENAGGAMAQSAFGTGADLLNPHAMMLQGAADKYMPGLPNFNRMSPADLKTHLKALTQAMNTMMLVGGCYHTFAHLGTLPGVLPLLHPTAASMNLAMGQPLNLMGHANPYNAANPMGDAGAAAQTLAMHHQAIAAAGQQFQHQMMTQQLAAHTAASIMANLNAHASMGM